MGSVGADALMFRSHDRGRSFEPLALTEGGASPMRAMVMRLRPDPSGSDGDFFALLTDGSIRSNERRGRKSPTDRRQASAGLRFGHASLNESFA
jgi:hypothetical protein